MEKTLTKSFQLLSEDAKDYYLASGVQTVHSISPIEFLRQVSANVPVVVKGGIKHWPAVHKWGSSYFRKIIGKKSVSVSVTPNGYADAIATTPSGHQYFVEPEQRQMILSDFLDILEKPEAHQGVFYIQQQNSNLTTEFEELICDIKEDISFASEALDSQPVAVNLWMGDKRAVTSMHKDPFENIYCVISGHKDFILHPPTDRPWIPYKCFPTAKYSETSPGHFEIIPQKKVVRLDHYGTEDSTLERVPSCDENTCDNRDNEGSQIPWICVDPLKPDLEQYPLYNNSTPIEVRVEAGDLLYLPSLWFHHVQQSHASIAVNYWYDMQFDIKYVYYQFIESLLPATEGTVENRKIEHSTGAQFSQ